ncbi:MAG: iron ABC transporter permease [Limnobacter sp.]|nr:iron ABC transporter permease [Limnobacter sp.]
MLSPAQRRFRLALLALLCLVVVVWAVSVGSVQLDLIQVLQDLLTGSPTGQSAMDAYIFRELRLPRAVAAFSVGGLLAMAGLLMQALLKNPLADPYILGVSGGAGLGGVAFALLGTVGAGVLIPVGAALGALAVIVLVFGLAQLQKVPTLERLLLMGVSVSSLCAALVSLMLVFSDDGLFRGLVFWLMGEINGHYWGYLLAALGLVVLAVRPLANRLNMVAMGDELAASVGVPVQSLKWCLYWLSAVATGIAVSAGGMIGFVGLVVPHAMRLLLGTDHRVLIPAVALGGGAFLCVADTLARTVLAPVQLPVGVVTALAGAPVFIWLLVRSGHGLRGRA